MESLLFSTILFFLPDGTSPLVDPVLDVTLCPPALDSDDILALLE